MLRISHSKHTRVWALVLVCLLPVLACDLLPSGVITDVVMAQDAKGEPLTPVSPTTAFQPNQSVIHAVVTVSNAQPNTAIYAQWVAVDVGGAMSPNTKIDEAQFTAEGSGRFQFTLPQKGKPWDPGKYKLDLYVNGELDRTVNFSVGGIVKPTVAPTPTQRIPCPTLTPVALKPSGYIKSVTMAEGTQGPFHDPLNPTNVFKTNATVHAVVLIQKAPANTQIKIEWYAYDTIGATVCNHFIEDDTSTENGNVTLDYSLYRKNGTPWPIGSYRVELSVNGKLDKIATFSIK